MKKIISFLAIMLFINTAFTQSKDELAIKNILNQQSIAWNEGDIEKFMQPYWHNDSLMFIGKSGITYGWQKTLGRYKKNYPDAAAIGTYNKCKCYHSPLKKRIMNDVDAKKW